MLQINYGSFYTLAEKKTSEMLFYSPWLKMVVNGILLFSFLTCASAGGALFYAEQAKPTMTYDTAKYHNMKNLSDKVTKSINIIEQARPFQINVCRIIQNFLAVKPENVAIDNIQIRPERYTVKGSANTVEQANEFSQSILFGQDRLVNLSDVKSKDNKVYWEINVTTKNEGKKGGKKK